MDRAAAHRGASRVATYLHTRSYAPRARWCAARRQLPPTPAQPPLRTKAPNPTRRANSQTRRTLRRKDCRRGAANRTSMPSSSLQAPPSAPRAPASGGPRPAPALASGVTDPTPGACAGWISAVSALEPACSPLEIAAAVHVGARLTRCAPGCACRAAAEADAAWPAHLAAAGRTVQRVELAGLSPGSLSRRLRSRLAANQSLVWRGETLHGALQMQDAAAGFLLRTLDPDTAAAGPITARALAAGRLWRVGRTRRPCATPRTMRQAVWLAEWIALALGPITPGGCPTGPGLAHAASGIAVYDLPGRPDDRELLAWAALRRWAAADLQRRAGSETRPLQRRLARAARLHAAEAGRLDAARVAGEAWPHLLLRARDLAQAAALEVYDGLLLHTGLAGAGFAALIDPPHEPLEGQALSETLYLARAGARPFRRLAARRLAGAASPAAIDVLCDLLWSPDGPTAVHALQSLRASAPERLWARAHTLIEGDAGPRVGASEPFARSLLAAALEDRIPEAAAWAEALPEDSPERNLWISWIDGRRNPAGGRRP